MANKLIKSMITIYQKGISPLLGHRCRFVPSCSQYAKDALDRYSLSTAVIMTVKRIAKCHPWHPGGFDPIKESK